VLTTILNPTVWLLVATFAAAVVAAIRGVDGRTTFVWIVDRACRWPILAALCLMSMVGLSSRVLIGYSSPGAYAEEVVAARTFLEQRSLYSADARGEMAEWMRESPAVTTPWKAVPGVTECQVNAMGQRARFFTNHAHTPMLLLAGVPIVHVGGGRALYVTLVVLSLASIGLMTSVLLRQGGIDWRSRRALLLLAALAGWQPVLAALRQGDAIVLAAGLLTLSWAYADRRSAIAGVAAGAAACLALPSIGGVPALLRTKPRSGLLATAIMLASVAATVAIAGPGVVLGFAQTFQETARTYAFAVTNYAVVGRFVGGHAWLPLATLAVVVVCCCVSGTSIDRAYGAFVVLGLLCAPVLWSQHLAVMAVPAAILLRKAMISRSPAVLAGWAMLVLVLSLPDAAAAELSLLLSLPSPSGGVTPLPSLSLLFVWSLLTFGGWLPRQVTQPAPVPLA
jgi:hypothetical protein